MEKNQPKIQILAHSHYIYYFRIYSQIQKDKNRQKKDYIDIILINQNSWRKICL